jgi:hypothetical protein
LAYLLAAGMKSLMLLLMLLMIVYYRPPVNHSLREISVLSAWGIRT